MSDYQGWTNYATWGVALILDNDQGTQEHRQELTRVAARQGHPRSFLAASLREYVDELAYTVELSDMAAQMLGAGLAEVDWDDLTETYLAE